MPMLAYGSVTVEASATAVYDGDVSVRLTVRNNSITTAIYLGDGSVTTSTGFPLQPGDGYEWPIRVNASSPLYAITASGTADLRWMTLE